MRKWIYAAGIRAIKTFCQGCVTLIGADYINIIDLDWPYIIGTAATMALLSLLTSVAGLPELKEETPEEDDFNI
jgi:hypothetical protein